MYNRLISSKIEACKKSVLLLGPRQVGKSTLMQALDTDLQINLSFESEFFLFQHNKRELEQRIDAIKAKTVFIDEIQRIPSLLNTIQALIDADKKLKFYLTGSSARKLRKGRANLLPGRLFSFHLPPLCLSEIAKDWREDFAMSYGSLPEVWANQQIQFVKQLLSSYSHHYLKEEIMAEALVRQVDGFVRFIHAAAVESGRYLDYSKLAQKAKIPRQSVVRHFEILEDTLIAQKVSNDPIMEEKKIDLVKHPRFYFFDLGVVNALRGSFDVNAERVGFLFEHLVYNQIINSSQSRNIDCKIHNFRTRGGFEVDFIVNIEGKRFAVECKTSDSIASSEISKLNQISQYDKSLKKIIIYRGRRELKDKDVWILPLPKALSIMGL